MAGVDISEATGTNSDNKKLQDDFDTAITAIRPYIDNPMLWGPKNGRFRK
jgi:hypothetical protein